MLNERTNNEISEDSYLCVSVIGHLTCLSLHSHYATSLSSSVFMSEQKTTISFKNENTCLLGNRIEITK